MTDLRALLHAFWESHVSLPQESQRVVQYCERPGFADHLPEPTRRALGEVNADITGVVTRFLDQSMGARVIRRRPRALNELSDFVAAGLRGA